MSSSNPGRLVILCIALLSLPAANAQDRYTGHDLEAVKDRDTRFHRYTTKDRYKGHDRDASKDRFIGNEYIVKDKYTGHAKDTREDRYADMYRRQERYTSADSALEGRWVIRGALDAGIDETVDSTAGSYRIGTTQALGFGYEFSNTSVWATQITLGYEFNEDDVGTTTNKFSTIPLELLMLYRLGRTRLGFGPGYHADPTYEAEIAGSSVKIELDDEWAFVAAVEYEPTRIFSIGARYTYVEYGLSNSSFVFDNGSTAEQLDASSLGVFLAAKF